MPPPSADAAAEPKAEVGVGPWEGELPQGEHWDPDLLADGDRRNVVDKYRYWKHEAIVADLDSKRHNFHIAIENWQHDLNIGTVVRTANAFLAKEVHIIGRRRWNRRGAMVTDRYQHVRHHPTVEDFVAWAQGEGLAIIGIDIFPDSVPLETYELPKDCVLVFGQEGPGLTPRSTKRRWTPCRSSSSAPPAPSTRPPPPRSRCTPGSAATCSASSRAKATPRRPWPRGSVPTSEPLTWVANRADAVGARRTREEKDVDAEPKTSPLRVG